MLSYVEHGRSQAIAQERTSSPFFAGGKTERQKQRSSLMASVLAASVFRNVLPREWITAGADAQGANCAAIAV